MCPDPQLLSIYVDGELPSPWKEKMEAHLKGCSVCNEKLKNFKHLHELFKKDNTVRRTYVERVVDEAEEERTYTEEEMRETKDRIWKRIESKRKVRSNVWRRRLSIPVPVAAAAAVILVLFAGIWVNRQTVIQNELARQAESINKVNFILASEEEELPVINPAAADLNGVLQYLGGDGTEIIIIQLPERNFQRSGEPAIIRAADYQQTVIPRR